MQVEVLTINVPETSTTKHQPAVFIENTTERTPTGKFLTALRGVYASFHSDALSGSEWKVFQQPQVRYRVPLFRYVVAGSAATIAGACSEVAAKAVAAASLFSIENSEAVLPDTVFLFVSQLKDMKDIKQLGFWVGVALRWPEGTQLRSQHQKGQ